jgi:hypothetical protein
MAKKTGQGTHFAPEELLSQLNKIDMGADELSKSAKVSPLEVNLLSLADVAIERETDLLRRLAVSLGKLKEKA